MGKVWEPNSKLSSHEPQKIHIMYGEGTIVPLYNILIIYTSRINNCTFFCLIKSVNRIRYTMLYRKNLTFSMNRLQNARKKKGKN